MQQIRGLIWFKGKSLEEVKSGFDEFRLDSVELEFFKSLVMDDRKISQPGVLITGLVDDKYSSKDVVNLFREGAGLENGIKECDVSIESEDAMKSLLNGKLRGGYIGIIINPPYELEKVYALASKIGESLKAKDVFVRAVESVKKKPLVCMDFIIPGEPEKVCNKAKGIVSSEGLSTGKIIMLSLEGS